MCNSICENGIRNAFTRRNHFAQFVCRCRCLCAFPEWKEWDINMRYGTKWRRTLKVIMMTKIEKKWLFKLSSLDLYLLRVILLTRERKHLLWTNERTNERNQRTNGKNRLRGSQRATSEVEAHPMACSRIVFTVCVYACSFGRDVAIMVTEIQFQCNFYIYFAYKSFLNGFTRA